MSSRAMDYIRLAVTPRHVETRDGSFLAVEQKYQQFWAKYGYELCLLPFRQDLDIEKYFQEMNIKGLLIAGGYRAYTEEIRKFEHKVIAESLKLNLPIFGVCCGLWSINGYFGGKLRWNEKHSKRNFKFVANYLFKKMLGKKHIPLHPVEIKGVLPLKEAIVNSYHRKVVDKLGAELVPFITAPDGEIEGIHNLKKNIIALQFHLEHGNCSSELEKGYMEVVGKMVKRVIVGP